LTAIRMTDYRKKKGHLEPELYRERTRELME
jgi:hypothetical protein